MCLLLNSNPKSSVYYVCDPPADLHCNWIADYKKTLKYERDPKADALCLRELGFIIQRD